MEPKFAVGQHVYVLPNRLYSAGPRVQQFAVAVVKARGRVLQPNSTVVDFNKMFDESVCLVEFVSPQVGGMLDTMTTETWWPESQLRDMGTSNEAELIADLEYYDGLGNAFWRGQKMPETELAIARLDRLAQIELEQNERYYAELRRRWGVEPPKVGQRVRVEYAHMIGGGDYKHEFEGLNAKVIAVGHFWVLLEFEDGKQWPLLPVGLRVIEG